MTWWTVYRPMQDDPDFPGVSHCGSLEEYDQVDFRDSMREDEVKESLINHDGYPSDIVIRPQGEIMKYALKCDDVDGSDIWKIWDEEPSPDDVYNILKDYHSEEVSRKAAYELVEGCGVFDVNNSSCTTYELVAV